MNIFFRLVIKKLNLTQQKQTFIRNTKILKHKINKKTKARFRCLSHLQPRNGAGPILQLLSPHGVL